MDLFPFTTMGSICECSRYNEEAFQLLEPADTCDSPCRGDATEICGGPTSFDLYRFLTPAVDEVNGVDLVSALRSTL